MVRDILSRSARLPWLLDLFTYDIHNPGRRGTTNNCGGEGEGRGRPCVPGEDCSFGEFVALVLVIFD